MAKWRYWIPDLDETRDDEPARYVIAERADRAAEKAGEHFHFHRDGWEWSSWPIEICVAEVLQGRCERGGTGDEMEPQAFEVDRHVVPEFEARRVRKKETSSG